jgi:hypothetical protein
VLAFSHGEDAGRGVTVVGRAHRHGVDLVRHHVEHFAVVVKPAGRFVRVPLLFQLQIVDVAQSDDISDKSRVAAVPRPFSAHANAGEIQAFQWVFAVSARRKRVADPPSGANQRRVFHKITTRRLVNHGCLPEL